MRMRTGVELPLVLAAITSACIAFWPGSDVAIVVRVLAGVGMLLLTAAIFALERYTLRPAVALREELTQLAAVPAGTGSDDIGALVAAVVRASRDLNDAREKGRFEAARVRELEQSLREAEERYMLAVRCADDGMWEWDLRTDALQPSPMWKAMLGYGEGEARDGRALWESLIHPDDLPVVLRGLERHAAGETSRFEQQLRLRHADGSWRWVLSRAAAIRHATGKTYRVVGLDTDITRVKRIESILNEIVEGTTGTYGEAFFQSLVRHFATALGVTCAFITECADQPPSRVRTLAFWANDGFADNIEYDLAGTPCESVICGGRKCFVPSGAGTRFPVEAGYEGYLGLPILGSDQRVIGHLAFLDRREMNDDILIDAVYRIFTARAGAELERCKAVAALGIRDARAA